MVTGRRDGRRDGFVVGNKVGNLDGNIDGTELCVGVYDEAELPTE